MARNNSDKRKGARKKTESGHKKLENKTKELYGVWLEDITSPRQSKPAKPDCIPKLWDEYDNDDGPIFYQDETCIKEKHKIKKNGACPPRKTSSNARTHTKLKHCKNKNCKSKSESNNISRVVCNDNVTNAYKRKIPPASSKLWTVDRELIASDVSSNQDITRLDGNLYNTYGYTHNVSNMHKPRMTKAYTESSTYSVEDVKCIIKKEFANTNQREVVSFGKVVKTENISSVVEHREIHEYSKSYKSGIIDNVSKTVYSMADVKEELAPNESMKLSTEANSEELKIVPDSTYNKTAICCNSDTSKSAPKLAVSARKDQIKITVRNMVQNNLHEWADKLQKYMTPPTSQAYTKDEKLDETEKPEKKSSYTSPDTSNLQISNNLDQNAACDLKESNSLIPQISNNFEQNVIDGKLLAKENDFTTNFCERNSDTIIRNKEENQVRSNLNGPNESNIDAAIEDIRGKIEKSFRALESFRDNISPVDEECKVPGQNIQSIGENIILKETGEQSDITIPYIKNKIQQPCDINQPIESNEPASTTSTCVHNTATITKPIGLSNYRQTYQINNMYFKENLEDGDQNPKINCIDLAKPGKSFTLNESLNKVANSLLTINTNLNVASKARQATKERSLFPTDSRNVFNSNDNVNSFTNNIIGQHRNYDHSSMAHKEETVGTRNINTNSCLEDVSLLTKHRDQQFKLKHTLLNSH